MNREIHVRICERLGVKFPGATRRPSKPPCRGSFQTAISCYGLRAAVVNVMVERRGN